MWDPAWVYRWEQKKLIDYLSVWAEEGVPPAAEQVLFFDFHTANSHLNGNFAQRTYRDLPSWEKRIAQSIARIFPALDGVGVNIKPTLDNEGWTGYLEWPDRKPIEIDQFGDGARHAFKVLAGLIALTESVDEAHPGLFLWEDPELFMHPATLARLLDTVMTLVAKKPLQVFMTTQSLEVLAWLVKYLDDSAETRASQVRTFRLELTDGTLSTRKFVGRGIGSWFRLFGDPRLSDEDEMVSPLYHLLAGEEEM